MKESPKRLKDRYHCILSIAAWERSKFRELTDDGTVCDIGTHSKRKLPSTYVVNCGYVWDWVKIQGRWNGKRGGKFVDRYIDVRQLYQDAKVASILCVGGPATL